MEYRVCCDVSRSCVTTMSASHRDTEDIHHHIISGIHHMPSTHHPYNTTHATCHYTTIRGILIMIVIFPILHSSSLRKTSKSPYSIRSMPPPAPAPAPVLSPMSALIQKIGNKVGASVAKNICWVEKSKENQSWSVTESIERYGIKGL